METTVIEPDVLVPEIVEPQKDNDPFVSPFQLPVPSNDPEPKM